MRKLVSILEDDLELNNAFAKIINLSEEFICVGQYLSAEIAIEQMSKTTTDLVLVDIQLPGKSGIEFIYEMKDLYPSTEFLVISAIENDESIFDALKSGASGYLVKTIKPGKLIDALCEVINGGSPMSSRIARRVVQSFCQSNSKIHLKKLTNREQEILTYLSEGFRYKEIADKMYLSTETIRTHIRNIYQKLQVNSRTEAINKVYHKKP